MVLAMGECRLGGALARDRTMHALEPRSGGVGRRCRQRVAMEDLDGLVRQAMQEIGLPIGLTPRRKPWIEHGLHLQVAHRSEQIRDRRAEPAQRREHLLAVFQRTGIAAGDTDNGRTIQCADAPHLRAELVGAGEGEVAIEAQHVAGLVDRIKHAAAEHGAELMQAILE